MTSAYSRPEYSSTRPSSIIEISVLTPGFSTGMRPFSTSTIMKNATRPSRWVGSTSAYGEPAIAWFIRYGLSDAETAPTVKKTRISAGSAMLPIQLARLAPRPPYGLAVSSPASEITKPASASTNAPPIRSARNASGSGSLVMIGTIAETVR